MTRLELRILVSAILKAADTIAGVTYEARREVGEYNYWTPDEVAQRADEVIEAAINREPLNG